MSLGVRVNFCIRLTLLYSLEPSVIQWLLSWQWFKKNFLTVNHVNLFSTTLVVYNAKQIMLLILGEQNMPQVKKLLIFISIKSSRFNL